MYSQTRLLANAALTRKTSGDEWSSAAAVVRVCIVVPLLSVPKN
jgi:hypothetical protein